LSPGWATGVLVFPNPGIQRNDVLLVLRAEGPDADVERTVLVEHIVIQDRVRDLRAVRMACGAYDFPPAREIRETIDTRSQLRGVADGHQASRLSRRTRDAGRRGKVVPVPYAHGPWLLASGAPRVLNSTPDEAVVSLETIVLLTMFTANASTSEIPAPSQPATLLAMMLLVTLTEYHRSGLEGKVTTSVR